MWTSIGTYEKAKIAHFCMYLRRHLSPLNSRIQPNPWHHVKGKIFLCLFLACNLHCRLLTHSYAQAKFSNFVHRSETSNLNLRRLISSKIAMKKHPSWCFSRPNNCLNAFEWKNTRRTISLIPLDITVVWFGSNCNDDSTHNSTFTCMRERPN